MPDLDWLRERWPGKLVLKGVEPLDASEIARVFERALEHRHALCPAARRLPLPAARRSGARSRSRVAAPTTAIPSELPRVIFELFTQENPHQAKGGFGVGLSLVKDLVHPHQGFVELRSDGNGRGSEFTVRLPLRTPSMEDASAP